ncbi:AAA family ATPase [Holophaga foetida]|uniref:ATP-binding protein n=1 Tax=Holophaga foetida TaxID=35839 RepID=UPI0002474677|nr:AAA family ATPase [Holophaga foetida]
MPVQIAVAGKGGTGKTSFCALLTRYLIDKRKVPILAVDADANANLNEALGLKLEGETVSELIASTKDANSIPMGMSQETYIEYKLNAALAEGKDVDLLVMGGPDGPGCFCFPNNILRKHLDKLLTHGYKYVVIDNEAGLEHISRRTTQDVDFLFVVSDSSARAIRSAGRVHELVKQIQTKVKNICLVVTRATPEDVELLREEIEKTGLTLAGIIPSDPLVNEFDIKGQPLFNLPAHSPAVKAAYAILDNLNI